MNARVRASGHQAILLPGAVLPAALAFPALLSALGDESGAVAKDLEVYAADAPDGSYSLDVEVDGVLRTADAAGFERFHLVGYSGGGASAVAFAARHPARLRSLALLEPAWLGNEELSAEEQALWRAFDRVGVQPPERMMAEFVRLQLAPGVEPPPPPPGPPPPWMAARPAGIRALLEAFKHHRLDTERLRSFGNPVYFALGGRSNPDLYARMAERARALFADFTLEVFEERHHFDPPHRVEPERLARSLERLWGRSQDAPPA